MTRHLTREELDQGLEHIRQSPRDAGRLEHIVVRSNINERSSLSSCVLSTRRGAKGDRSESDRGASEDEPHTSNQVSIMNARVIEGATVTVGDVVKPA